MTNKESDFDFDVREFKFPESDPRISLLSLEDFPHKAILIEEDNN
jgi:hypothetical protein